MTTPLFNLPSSSTSTLLFNSTSSEQGTSSSTTQTNPVMTLSVPTHSSTSRTQLLQQQQQPPPRTTTRTPPPTTAASPQPTISTTFTSLPPSQQQSFVESIFSEVIEEMNEETCLRAHKDLKYGLLCSTCGTDRDILQCRPGFDVFGQSMRQLPPNELLQCPNCQRFNFFSCQQDRRTFFLKKSTLPQNLDKSLKKSEKKISQKIFGNRSVTAARFVPHLEKCMGLGRASSRLATRRIAAIGKDLTSERRIDEVCSSLFSLFLFFLLFLWRLWLGFSLFSLFLTLFTSFFYFFFSSPHPFPSLPILFSLILFS